jgi:DNA-directed RNA polymerase subunit RPC12/RpoP
MEHICSRCHAVLGDETRTETKADWCPACGGALIERENQIPDSPHVAPQEIDHRGLILPRRHALGGIITPQ